MKKIIALVLACLVCVGIGIGGTMAWLTAKTDSVINTFTVGDVNISIQETENGKSVTERNYNFVPGDTLGKDPTVTVKANSEACYLFVHVQEENNTLTDETKIITWDIDPNVGWTKVEINGKEQTGYYYKIVSKDTKDQNFQVLKGDTTHTTGIVTISNAVKKSDVNALTSNKPQIIVKAAAIQSANINGLADAWSNLDSDFKPVSNNS
jgi:predicted ribosomally synthesized peptide with SipW-like signal peptide